MVASTTPILDRPTRDDLISLRDTLKKSVQTIVDKTHPESILPVVGAWCLNRAGQTGIAIIGLDGGFNSDEEKDAAMKAVAITLLQKRLAPLAIGIVTEAWVVHRGLDDPRKMPRPADCPDRQEIVMVQVVSVDKRVMCSVALTRRDADDQIVALEPFKDNEGGEANLLSDVFRYYARAAAVIAQLGLADIL